MSPQSATEGEKIHIEGVLFDYGNVLCHPQQASDLEAMARVIGLPKKRLEELYWKHRLDYDRGDLMGESYWSTIARADGGEVTPAQVEQLVALDAAGWARENVDTIRWVEQLHGAGLRLALLSNMPYELSRSLTASGSWSRFFQHALFSCDLRRNKPAPEVYEACLKALDLPAGEVLFVDDIAINIDGAAQVGIHGVLFDTTEKTQARVAQKFDVPVPAAQVGVK